MAHLLSIILTELPCALANLGKVQGNQGFLWFVVSRPSFVWLCWFVMLLERF